jgi:hypothetical protein
MSEKEIGKDEAEDTQGNMPLRHVAPEGNEDTDAQLLKRGVAPLEDEDTQGNMPLRHVAPEGNEDTQGDTEGQAKTRLAPEGTEDDVEGQRRRP